MHDGQDRIGDLLFIEGDIVSHQCIDVTAVGDAGRMEIFMAASMDAPGVIPADCGATNAGSPHFLTTGWASNRFAAGRFLFGLEGPLALGQGNFINSTISLAPHQPGPFEIRRIPVAKPRSAV
jgi:hypothetical protein